MKNLRELKNLRGKKVLLRLDLNVPTERGVIKNDFRIKKVVPTIEYLKKQGAIIIIISHIGRGKEDTLKPVFNCFKKYFRLNFVENFFNNEDNSFLEDMQEGDIVLLENLRKNDGEVENKTSFAKKLASLGDIYVNDAFSVSHRKHASIVGVPKYLPSYFGLLFEEEVKYLSQIFKPPHPAVFVLGGNKISSKLPLVKKMLKICDSVFVGGALANDFFREKGFNIGTSVVSDNKLDLKNLLKNNKLFLPSDVVVKKENRTIVKYPNEVLDDEMILDAGPETLLELWEILKDSKFVLFNGPLGDYTRGFNRATSDLVRMISKLKIKSVIGGGDTVANIFELGFEDKFDFISTGGGAMLEFLIKETLPGIQAINNSKIGV